MREKLVVAMTAVFAALAAVLPASAMAQQPQCGGVITKNTTLQQDLLCDSLASPPDVALTIGADHITLNLNGHQIVGAGGTGIKNVGHRGVTIRNGTVTGFTTLVRLEGAGCNKLTALSGSSDGNAIELKDSAHNVLKDLHVNGGESTGLSLTGSSENRVVDSVIGGSTVGALLSNSHANQLVRTRFAGEDGLRLTASNDNRIVDSVGFAFYYTGATITGSGNTVVRGQFNGGQLGFGWALKLSGDGNVVRDSTLAGDWSPQAALEVSAGDGNVVRDNQLTTPEGGDEKDGLFVSVLAINTLLRGNVANGFPDDGIQVDSPSSLLRFNVANDNGDLGIEAVPGVTGRGNTASGNGNPLQCLNIACS